MGPLCTHFDRLNACRSRSRCKIGFFTGFANAEIVKNIDSRPPTLLRQFDVLQTDLPKLDGSRHLTLVTSSQQEGNIRLFALASSPLRSLHLQPSLLFDSNEEGFSLASQAPHEWSPSVYGSKITGLVRTPDGKGIAIKRSYGGEVYSLHKGTLVLNHSWSGVHDVVVLDRGMLPFTSRSSNFKL